jgi:hypothetical protein
LGRKYTLRHFGEDEKNNVGYQLLLRFEPKAHWAFSRLGDEVPLAACFESEGRFSCKAIVQSLEFDSSSRRFLVVALLPRVIGNGFVAITPNALTGWLRMAEPMIAHIPMISFWKSVNVVRRRVLHAIRHPGR